MRARDVRAIAFCVVSTLVLAVATHVLLESGIVTLALTAAYAVWLITRPRMQRTFRRMRGQPDWSGYFHEETVRDAERRRQR
jgi:hypothetical protein